MDDGRIVALLERIAAGVDKLVEAVPKPASRARRLVEMVVTIATVAGILSAIDTIKNWIFGG